MNNLKKYFKNTYKSLIQAFFKLIYGKVIVASTNVTSKLLIVKEIRIEDNNYNIYKTENCRLFTTSVHDQSVIINNNLIKGPSFQLRVKNNDSLFARNNAVIEDNIVLKIGTPRFIKKVKGKVFSLLAGGAAKTNYFHWLFEVLPKFEILKRIENIENIDFFYYQILK